MLHLGQKLGWVFENRALKKLLKFEKKKSIFRQVLHLKKNLNFFLLIINQNPSFRPKIGMVS